MLCDLCSRIIITAPSSETPIRIYASQLELEECAKKPCGFCRMIAQSHREEHKRWDTFNGPTLWDAKTFSHSDLRVYYTKASMEFETNITWSCSQSDLHRRHSMNPGLGGLFAHRNDPAANYFVGREIMTSPTSDIMYDLVKSWIKQCVENHRTCKTKAASTLPTRVIDVALGRSIDQAFLAEPDPGTRGEYAALSYCWGGSQTATLTSGTFAKKRSDIGYRELDKSLQDAIFIARKLDIPYIWIDSQCILQDSAEDWQRESARMGSIYHDAFLTIQLAAAENSRAGCLAERPRPEIPPVKLRFESPDGTLGSVYVRYRSVVRDEPIHKRGWTFQEELLSRRVLCYGHNQLSWECREAYQSESNHVIREEEFYFGLPKPTRVPQRFNISRPNFQPDDSYHQLSWTWANVVENFTQRQLTFSKDKLPALAGLSRHISTTRPGDKYLAGIWRNDLPRALLWGCIDIGVRPLEYRAPSWSWASLDGPIGIIGLRGMSQTMDFCRVIDTGTTVKDSFEFGEVLGGYIKLRGRLKEAWRMRIENNQKLDDVVQFLFDRDRPLTASDRPYSLKIGFCQVNVLEPVRRYNQPSSTWCFRVDTTEGLMLHRRGNGEFERIGTFELDEDKLEWFEDATEETILIV
ncbi:heterokaryon incompatibility protein-domain-containing protein [Hypoxylon sp. FL0543]|nr:heterokaryon incompatibility protein-domain-containing protein [Hypoxylon sp. FL0543]